MKHTPRAWPCKPGIRAIRNTGRHSPAKFSPAPESCASDREPDEAQYLVHLPEAVFAHPTYYHNSFLIADPREAWILETVDRRWAARQYSDFIYTTFGKGRQRCRRSQQFLKANGKPDAVSAVMAALRDHGDEDGDGFRPGRGLFDFTICAHAGFGPVRASQTTGSMVAYLHPEGPIFFLTGTAAPCTSIFKPLWLDAGLPDLGPEPDGAFDPATLFWQHERLHRATLLDYSHRLD